MNYLFNAQQNQIITSVKSPSKKGSLYQLTNEQKINQDFYKYEGEEQDLDGSKRRISCDILLRYSDQLMRCLDELIQQPQDNIIRYLDFFIYQENRYLYIIYEHIKQEQFLDYQIYNNQLVRDQKIQVCTDIAQGIYQLHQLSYRHRDINPKNICQVNGKFKLTNLNHTVHFIMKDKLDRVGDSSYWSQELLNETEQNETIDIFAFVCVMFEVFSSQKLFNNTNNRLKIPQDKKQQFQEIPENIKQFIYQVIEGNKRDLKQFIESSGVVLNEDKKQPQNNVVQQRQTMATQFIANNEFRNDMKQYLPAQFGYRASNQTVATPMQFGTIKPQFNQFPNPPQSATLQPQQSQQFSFQPFQQQKAQYPFWQQAPYQQQMFKQSTGSQKKFQTATNLNEQGFQQVSQQIQFNPNANVQNFQQQAVQILATDQVNEISLVKNNSLQNEFFQTNQFTKEGEDEKDIFKCQIDTQKEEREREQQKQMEIRNQIQKIVKCGYVEGIVQNVIEQLKMNEQQKIEQILSNMIVRNVRLRIDSMI
ncbi:unnamed protein product [Paramecium sonneborni]|uniref:Protein kinase domain-containing protein n=1 Tax=Paramecium sonneborni TaxID=65129 RepID=A0A8S1QX80_9CILI|nr:unnamed protein product [Paramecium sonneborni]